MRTRTLPLVFAFGLIACGGGDGGGGPVGPGNDNTPPTLTVVAPGAGATTAGRSGFNLQVSYSDAGSGIDPATFSVTASSPLGGVLTRQGVSAIRSAGSELAPLFGSVTATGATLTVPDSIGFAPGPVTLTVRVRDQAGNLASATHSFTVAPSPDGVVMLDASASPGQKGVQMNIGLRNGAAIAGFQLDVLVDAAIASVDSAFVLGRAGAMTSGSFGFVAPGRLRLALFNHLGSTVAAGEDIVVRLFVSVANDAALGAHTWTATDVRLADVNGTSRPVVGSAASLTVQ